MLRLLMISSVLASLGAAPAASALTANQKVFEQVQIKNADGTTSTKLIEPTSITPGDKVVYSLTYSNDQSEPADDIVLTMPVPKTIAFIEGTADSASASLVYSVDKGSSFGSRESRMVIGDDGAMRPARADEITHIRWTITASLAPGEQGELSFAGVLK